MYKFVEYIKDAFARPVISTVPNANVATDAQTLDNLCCDMHTLRARNGNYYVYFVLKNINDVGTVRDLLGRNGIRGRLHFSRYYYTRPVLRVRHDLVENNELVKTLGVYSKARLNKVSQKNKTL